MNKTATQFIKDIPPWGKGILAVGGLAILFFGGKAIISAIQAAVNKGKNQQAVKAAGDEIKSLAARGIVPSYHPAQYKIWADAAEECYQGWGTCTGDTIFTNMKNDADILSLITAFGTRTISSGTWNPASDTTGNLAKIIRSELSESEVNAINNVLGKKGITYRF